MDFGAYKEQLFIKKIKYLITKEYKKDELIEILGEHNSTNSNSETMTESESIMSTAQKPAINDSSKEFDYVFRKPWHKLAEIHKVIKVREFLQSLKLVDKDRIILEEVLINSIKVKKLTKKDKVIYDEAIGRIIAIPDLKEQNGKVEYVE